MFGVKLDILKLRLKLNGVNNDILQILVQHKII